MTNWFSRIARKGDSNSSPLPPKRNDSSAEKLGVMLLNEFEVERELGRGGMGKVYLVRSRTTGRKFALKEALVKDDGQQKAFLAELQTWIDLPEHTNILACRFFRTVGNETLIFADYCQGGSLADWIANGSLHTLEQKLDIAIQFAWGIHAIHERGLVHQDIKPGNVLMTKNGVPKVADFGLARAKQRMGATSAEKGAQSAGDVPVLVTSGGMTPAYASPEQRAGRALSSKTDMWSWAVSVMDMFLGGVSCPYGGHIAAETLDANVSAADEISEENIPEDIVEVLRRCFCPEPAQRWVNLADVVDALVSIYEVSTGTIYNKILRTPKSSDGGHLELPSHERYALTPDEWLSHAERLAGKVIKRRVQEASTAKGSLVESIRTMDEVVPVLERHIDDAQRESLQRYFDAVYVSADLHRRLSDEYGCLNRLRAAIESLQNRDTGMSSVRFVFGDAYRCYSVALRDYNHFEESLDAIGKALGLFESVPDESGQISQTVRCLQTLGSILGNQEKDSEALQVFEKVVALLDQSQSLGSQHTLALALNNGGGCAMKCGNSDLAIAWYGRCIQTREEIIRVNRDDWETRDNLAGTLGNLVAALIDRGRESDALEAIDKAIVQRSEIMRKNAEPELQVNLAKSRLNRAHLLRQMKRWNEAVYEYSRVIDTVSSLFELEGRSDLKSLLKDADSSQDSALQRIEERSMEEADALYGDLVEIERSVITQFHGQLRVAGLSRLLSNWAGVKRSLNKVGSAWLLLDEAIDILESSEQSEQLLEIQMALMMSYRNLCVLLIDLQDFVQAEALCAKARAYYSEFCNTKESDAITENFFNIGLCMVHAQAAQGKKVAARELLDELSGRVTALDDSFRWRHQVSKTLRDFIGDVVAKGDELNCPASRDHQIQCIAFEAQTLRNSGDFENAIRLYKKALILRPEDGVFWNNLSVAYSKSGNHLEALRCCDEGLEILPDSANLWHNRGLSCYALSDYREAALSFDKAFDHGIPDAKAQAVYCWDILEGKI